MPTTDSPEIFEGSIVDSANKIVDAFRGALPSTEGWGVPIGSDYKNGVMLDPRMNEVRVTILNAGKLLVLLAQGLTYRRYFDNLVDGRGCAQHEKLNPHETEINGRLHPIHPDQFAAAFFDPEAEKVKGLLRISTDTIPDRHYGRALMPSGLDMLDISPYEAQTWHRDFSELADSLVTARPLSRADISSHPMTPAMAYFFRDTDN